MGMQAIEDLEFDVLLKEIAVYAQSEAGRNEILRLRPIKDIDRRISRLQQVEEYRQSLYNDTRIPAHDFRDIRKSLELLALENGMVPAKQWVDVLYNLHLAGRLRRFFHKQKGLYPVHAALNEQVPYRDVPAKMISKIIEPTGEIADTASPVLAGIRQEQRALAGEINAVFYKQVRHYRSLQYLDEIRESVVDGIRVLAVKAHYKSQVKGSVRGTSKNGSIVYILPEPLRPSIRRKEELAVEEYEEQQRILRELTAAIRPYSGEISLQYAYLIQMDVIRALALFAFDIHAGLPVISLKKKIYRLKKAYHPLLLIHHKKSGLPVVPQDINLDEDNRIMVISGPNAGGKSITLKMLGLLQLMIQSGILLPVDPGSEIYGYGRIITDIGDHQSIENHLSTYSYRLRRMSKFLRLCNSDTLFLIDEFGTGSDPELGGALAEVMLEALYDKGAFGALTTHYTNIKTLAGEKEGIFNANMRFDKRSLQPRYELIAGEAGSSFTFEVAEKNHIPYSLINKAKKRVAKAKVRLDKSLVKLQQERRKLESENKKLEEKRQAAEQHVEALSKYKKRWRELLEKFDALYEHRQKMLKTGEKVNGLIQTYFQTGNKKRLLSDFMKWVEQQQLKKLKSGENQPADTPLSGTKKKKKKTKDKFAETERILQKELAKIKKNKAGKKEKKPEKPSVRTGDTVRIAGGYAVGVVERIEKGEAFVLSGQMLLRIPVERLEPVTKGT